MYALIDYIGNQILLKEGEKVRIPFLNQKVGSKITFENVLFYDDGSNKTVGSPYIKSLSFTGKIDSHGRDKKVLVFKKKRRKGHQKKNGHIQKFTYVSIDKFSTKKTSKAKASTSTKKITKAKASTKKKTNTTKAKKTAAPKVKK